MGRVWYGRSDSWAIRAVMEQARRRFLVQVGPFWFAANHRRGLILWNHPRQYGLHDIHSTCALHEKIDHIRRQRLKIISDDTISILPKSLHYILQFHVDCFVIILTQLVSLINGVEMFRCLCNPLDAVGFLSGSGRVQLLQLCLGCTTPFDECVVLGEAIVTELYLPHHSAQIVVKLFHPVRQTLCRTLKPSGGDLDTQGAHGELFPKLSGGLLARRKELLKGICEMDEGRSEFL